VDREVMMRVDVSKTAILLTLLCAGIGFTMACGAGGAPPTEPAEPAAAEKVVEPDISHEVAFEAKPDEERQEDVEVRPWRPVKTITVQRGEGIKFIVRNLTAWILIPDGKLEPGSGGTDWTVTDSYIAVKIDRGNATVVVPDDYPHSKEPTEIWYSVLVEDGVQWDYAHGDSPPRMIIPP
jgi:hypothetical protein